MPKNGLVKISKTTFSAVASVSIDNCFSTTYTHYLVKRDISGTAGQSVLVRLRVGGADASGADYRYQYIDAASTTVAGARGTGQTSFGWGLGIIEGTAIGYTETWISNPFETVRTTAWCDTSSTVTGNIVLDSFVFEHDLATSYTGFTASVGSGTLTGSITVFGLVKS